MKNRFGKLKMKLKNLLLNFIISKVDVYDKPKEPMLSMISLQLLVRNWPVSSIPCTLLEPSLKNKKVHLDKISYTSGKWNFLILI